MAARPSEADGSLAELVSRGWLPQVQARVWASQWTDGRDGFTVSVQLELAEPHLIIPANAPPGVPHRTLPLGAAIQVTGEVTPAGLVRRWWVG